MAGIASVVLAGNITRDPELNESGKVLRLSVAVNRYQKNADGEGSEEVSFFDVKVLGARASGLAKILAKGGKITVQGDLVQERWETKEGDKRSTVLILAREVVLGGSGKTAASDEAADDNTAGW